MASNIYVKTRKDRSVAQLVEQGILMSHQLGRREAASFMNEHGVAFKMIVRVLNSPQDRRTGALLL